MAQPTTYYSGIDLHKQTSFITTVDPDGTVIHNNRSSATTPRPYAATSADSKATTMPSSRRPPAGTGSPICSRSKASR
jgi:hypothetical protein